MNLSEFYYDELKWCGCGNAEAALDFMRDVLAAIGPCGKRDDWEGSRRRMSELIGEESNGALALSYLYMLDAVGLTEHGGSVWGCWLTEKGERILHELQRDDWRQRFEDGEGELENPPPGFDRDGRKLERHESNPKAWKRSAKEA